MQLQVIDSGTGKMRNIKMMNAKRKLSDTRAEQLEMQARRDAEVVRQMLG